MSRRIGNVVILEEEPADICAYCGKVDELRPYGRDGARICYDCGMKPENAKTTKMMLNKFLDGSAVQ